VASRAAHLPRAASAEKPPSVRAAGRVSARRHATATPPAGGGRHAQRAHARWRAAERRLARERPGRLYHPNCHCLAPRPPPARLAPAPIARPARSLTAAAADRASARGAQGGVSGAVAKTLTAPIERVKLLIQTQDANPRVRIAAHAARSLLQHVFAPRFQR